MPKRRKPQRQPALDQFKRELRAQGVIANAKIVRRPASESKISAVFSEFIDPFTEYATNAAAYVKLIALGVCAWNAALLPEDERQK